jgi:hypothetical protein
MVADEERRRRQRWLRLSEVFDGGYELEGVRHEAPRDRAG